MKYPKVTWSYLQDVISAAGGWARINMLLRGQVMVVSSGKKKLSRVKDWHCKEMRFPALSMELSQSILDALGGLKGAKRILNGKAILKAKPRQFPIWKTFTTKLTRLENFVAANKAKEFGISHDAQAILEGPHCQTAAEKGVLVNLAKISVADLGFPKGESLPVILSYLDECGAAHCHWSLVLDTRVLYKNQGIDEPAVIYAEPIVVPGRPSNCRSLLKLTHSPASGRRWIDVHEDDLNEHSHLKPYVELIMVVPNVSEAERTKKSRK